MDYVYAVKRSIEGSDYSDNNIEIFKTIEAAKKQLDAWFEEDKEMYEYDECGDKDLAEKFGSYIRRANDGMEYEIFYSHTIEYYWTVKCFIDKVEIGD